jgi:predicted transposase YbfD/YdcC
MGPDSLSVTHHFAALEDPRLDRSKAHQLLDIVVVALCAILGGADSWVAVEVFGNAKLDWFKRFLELRNGIPSHDTFGRVFRLLEPQQFQRCFLNWIESLTALPELKHVAIDGKTLRGSFDRHTGKAALHLVSAWANELRLTLGQVAVDDKSNEITAIPKLLEMLELGGALVTIDALGCQKDIAAAVRAQGADYLLTVKANQGNLFADILDTFDEVIERTPTTPSLTYQCTENKAHGRDEVRQCYVTDNLNKVRDRGAWVDLNTLGMVVGERTVDGETTQEARYFISSRPLTAVDLLAGVRGHWEIETCLHWSLDVTFHEDGCRTLKDHGPENLALLRRITLSLLKRANNKKMSISMCRAKAGWDEGFMEEALFGERLP